MSDRRIEYRPLSAILSATSNPKRHDIDGVRRSIGRFGFTQPALLDERTGRLVAGHGRLEALTALRESGQSPPAGIQVQGDEWMVPVVCGWASRSDAEADAYLVADNRYTELGGWDAGELAALVGSIAEVDAELAHLTGFSDDDLAELLGEGEVTELPPALDDGPAAPPSPPADPVSKRGDLWRIGRHRLICGDCRDFDVIERLMDGVRVNLAFTSPPYASQRTYDESSGFTPIPPDGYVDWFEEIQANVRAVLASDGSWFVNIKEHCEDGQRHLYVKDLTIAHVRRWGWRFVDELCWVDASNGFPGSFPNRFKDAWEPVFHFAASAPIRFNPLANGHVSEDVLRYSPDAHMDMREGGYAPAGARNYGAGLARPSNVIKIPAGGDGTHSAAFPVALPAWFIRAYTDPTDAVLDPFAGSGTTLLAAHQEQRIGYGCEISPAYCDLICRRLQEAIGVIPDRMLDDGTMEPHDFTA
jgi:DNA modification methylase